MQNFVIIRQVGVGRINAYRHTEGRTGMASVSYFSQLLSIMSKHWDKIYGLYLIKQVHIALNIGCFFSYFIDKHRPDALVSFY